MEEMFYIMAVMGLLCTIGLTLFLLIGIAVDGIIELWLPRQEETVELVEPKLKNELDIKTLKQMYNCF